MNSSFSMMSQGWLYSLPTLIATAVCLVIVINKARQAPQAAMLGAIGFGVLLAISLLDPIIRGALTNAMASQSGTATYRANYYLILTLVERILAGGAYLCLATAIFVDRPERPEDTQWDTNREYHQ